MKSCRCCFLAMLNNIVTFLIHRRCGAVRVTAYEIPIYRRPPGAPLLGIPSRRPLAELCFPSLQPCQGRAESAPPPAGFTLDPPCS